MFLLCRKPPLPRNKDDFRNLQWHACSDGRRGRAFSTLWKTIVVPGGGGFLQSKNTWKRRVCQKTGLIQTLNFWVHPRLMRGFTTDASRVKHAAFVRFRKAIFMKLSHIIELLTELKQSTMQKMKKMSEDERRWMKMNEDEWRWMKMNEDEWRWMKMIT